MNNDFYQHFRSTLLEYCPVLKNVAKRQREHLVWCIFAVASGGAKHHREYIDCCSFSCKWHIEEGWRSGAFVRFCLENGVFDITTNYSKDTNYTKGYQLTENMQQIFMQIAIDYLNTITGTINIKNSKKNAIMSRDNCKNNRVFPNIQLSNAYVRINQEEVQHLFGSLEQQINEQHPLYEKYIERGTPLIAQSRLNLVSLLAMTKNTDGYLLCQYRQVQSGRLYAYGYSHLQNISSVIKEHALSGCYEYDIVNCHYTLLFHLVKKYRPDIRLESLEAYVMDRDGFLLDTQFRIAIDRKKLKTALIALIYGANLTSFLRKAAVVQILGKVDAEKFVHDCEIKGLYRDLRTARNIIIENTPLHRGMYINAVGKVISPKEDKANILAHILQGLEADALYMAIEQSPDDIVLTQHDGFTCRKPIDVRQIEARFEDKHGIDIRYEDKVLQGKRYL